MPRVRPRRPVPRAPYPSRGRPPAPSDPRSRRTASLRHGAPGASPGRASRPRPGTARRTSCTAALPGGAPCTPATATTASHPSAPTPGAPRSTPAADATGRSAAKPETVAVPAKRRRPPRVPANSARTPRHGAGSRPPSTATSPRCEQSPECSTPRRSTAAAPLESCASTTSCSPVFVPPAKARRVSQPAGCPAPLSANSGDRFGPESVIGFDRNTQVICCSDLWPRTEGFKASRRSDRRSPSFQRGAVCDP